MPPRFAYWTIILEGKPTAFRAQHRDDLVPTFKQLQTKHPDVVMMWFGRGRLWTSPEEARAADRRGTERRKPDWRPGGEHRDPRARFDIPRDEKRRRFAAKLKRDWRDQQSSGTGSGGDRFPPRRDEKWRDERPANRGPRPPFKARDDRERKPWKPEDQQQFRGKDRSGQERSAWKPAGSRPPKPGWRDRKPDPRGPRVGGQNPNERRGPGGKPQSFRPKGPGQRGPAGPHGFSPKGRDDRGGGDRPKRFTPKAWKGDRGRGPKPGGRGGGRGSGGQSR